MDFLTYLLEVNFYMLIFYSFYIILLRKETFYNVNRFFLIFTVIGSFLLPLIQIGVLQGLNFSGLTGSFQSSTAVDPRMFTEEPFNQSGLFKYSPFLVGVYLVGFAAFVVLLITRIAGITRLITKSKWVRKGEIVFINLERTSQKAFSFFNFLFIHSELEEKDTVIAHELVHIDQKHSVDVLLFEMVQALCWFNPIVYLMKRDIRLVHEYIADEVATNTSLGKHAYALFLIRNSFGMPNHSISSQIFNQSILKRRINMLNKQKTASRARLRLLLLLPLTGAMICVSTMGFKKSYGVIDLYPEKYDAYTMQSTTTQQRNADYFAPVKYDPKTKTTVSAERKLIVINGKIMNSSAIGTVKNIARIVSLNPADAVKKYGRKASAGALEFNGSAIKVSSTLVLPPPPPPRPGPNAANRNQPAKKASGTFYVAMKYDPKTKQVISGEKRAIIINGEQISNLRDFWGVKDATTIQFIGPETGKYGGKGAVVINGPNVKILKKTDVPPPPPLPPMVKFPPPVVKPDRPNFIANWKYDEVTNKMVSVENRLIIINGEKLKDISDFGGVTHATTVNELAPSSSGEYGEEGKNGVVIITGKNVHILKSNSVPPPPPVGPRDQVKFPPPIVKPDKVKKKGN